MFEPAPPRPHLLEIGVCADVYAPVLTSGSGVICVETRHMQAVLKVQINKTDRNDARGIAQMMRVGVYRPVHVKTPRSQKLRMLLTHRNPAPDDDPRCRPGGGADLSRNRRCASPIPKIQVGRGSVWADVLQISIRRDRLEWQDIALRR